MTKRAVCLIRRNPQYRREAFVAAFKRLGYDVVFDPIPNPNPDDVLITWNRYGTGARQADTFEKVGAAVFIVENSYLPMKDTKKAFAVSLNHHVGAGSWPRPTHSRLETLDIDLRPWRERGKTVLVLPQRGIGHPDVAMPKRWADTIFQRLRTVSIHPLHVRRHPEMLKERDRVPLEKDLAKAWCVVTWASSAALKAMVAGYPVFFEFKKWIGRSACIPGVSKINHADPIHLMGDREAMLANLAWAQWSVEEIFDATCLKMYLEYHAENKQ